MSWDEARVAYRRAEEQRGLDLLGAAVKRRRLRLGLSQVDVQRLTGIHQSIISRIERGRRWGLSTRRFAALVAVLDGLDFGVAARPEMWRGHQGVTPNPYLARKALEAASQADKGLEGVPDQGR